MTTDEKPIYTYEPDYTGVPAIGTLYVDCPWPFNDALPGPKRGAAKHYRTCTIEELEQYPLPPLLPDCRMFFWRVASMQQEALDVIAAWGFTLKSEIVWAKTTTTGKLHNGMGRQVRMAHEVCLIATRGRPATLVRDQRSIFNAAYRGHSVKPEEMYWIIERLSAGPYCELFARRPRAGWYSFGDELGGAAFARAGADGEANAEDVDSAVDSA